jgi:hypothetical protein
MTHLVMPADAGVQADFENLRTDEESAWTLKQVQGDALWGAS